MSKIETYWDDIAIYYVEFSALDVNGIIRIHHKTLAIPITSTEEEVSLIVGKYFYNIIEVVAIDMLTEGLLLKEQSII